MLVENPKGSINKYEYHTPTGLIKLDRVLYEQIPYPIEYGAIPGTWDEDDDPLDVMCLITYPTFPNCLISVRPVAVMLFDDCGEIDDKILAVPVDDVRFRNIQDVGDVDPHTLDEIGFFFKNYKELQFKYKGKDASVEVKEWKDKKSAHEIIEAAVARFGKLSL
ncbi:inorganic pyrophosphatase [Candidatus Dojkabacteria bacterium]|nr:inorganic pyrophosphatase [Candidatus Dojkabacteria bacterium]